MATGLCINKDTLVAATLHDNVCSFFDMQGIKTECFSKLFPSLKLLRSSVYPSPPELPP